MPILMISKWVEHVARDQTFWQTRILQNPRDLWKQKVKSIIYGCSLFGSSLGFPFGAQRN